MQIKPGCGIAHRGTCKGRGADSCDEIDVLAILSTFPSFLGCFNFESNVHQTLPVTPAMEAGISDHVWSLKEVVSLLDKNVSMAA